MADKKIKVLIVDDDPVIRKVLERCLSMDSNILVLESAVDAYDAREKIIKYSPDVLTLDIEMPRMDGLTFLKILMAHHPLPTIVMSSFTPSGSKMAMKALEAGAIDVMSKSPRDRSLAGMAPLLVEKVQAASMADLNAVQTCMGNEQELYGEFDSNKVVLLASSTGGIEALIEIIPKLPSNFPPVCIVQHLPAEFSETFAEYLNKLSRMEVKEAENGDELRQGRVLIAPGGYHMTFERTVNYCVKLIQDEARWHQRPSADVMFETAQALPCNNIIAGVLTGMGRDGAEGMLKLRNCGAHTFAQDQSSSAVYGMPKIAFEIGAAERVIKLEEIPRYLCELSLSKKVETVG